jgi:predicted phage baseplate assembly protein
LEAGEFELRFSIDPTAWRVVDRFESGPAHEYDGSDGDSIRFGDGVFGEMPNDGDVFEVRYRTSLGAIGNVPADTVTDVDPAWSTLITQASNPFAAEDGADAESIERVRSRAPFEFQTRTFRAVRPEDYDAAARTLAWVQRTGTQFRWTGSWPTVFSTVDPLGSASLGTDQLIELVRLLNRYRLAGYECYAPLPRYVSFDLQIFVCATSDAFQGDVIAGMESALRPVRRSDGSIGFFHVDNFTLGTPFERSRLEAAIQEVPGVAGVQSIEYRRRGVHRTFVNLPMRVPMAPGEVLLIENNPSRPERGSYRVTVEGGR